MTTPRSDLVIAPDQQALFEAAAEYLVLRASAAAASSGRFTIALSGGSTPKGLYEVLARPEWRTRVDWSRWQVFWSDERLVPPDDERSNFFLAQRALLGRVGLTTDQVHRVPVEAGDPASAYEAEILASFREEPGEVPRFDLILLGLGSDGHTASLFPGMPSLEEWERLVVRTPRGTLPPPVDRVTFTFPLLNAAQAVLFLVSGTDKLQVLRRVLAGGRSLPAARVQPSAGELRWFVDTAAMGRGAQASDSE